MIGRFKVFFFLHQEDVIAFKILDKDGIILQNPLNVDDQALAVIAIWESIWCSELCDDMQSAFLTRLEENLPYLVFCKVNAEGHGQTMVTASWEGVR